MDIAINFWAVLVCAVVAMVVGFVWYGPLFGKKWMQIYGATEMDEIKRKEMQKKAGPLYALQFVLVLFQAYVLAHFIAAWDEGSGIQSAIWIWAAFVIPTLASASMWNNDPGKVKWAKFLIQAGYNLVLFIIFGLILANWR